MKQIMLSIIAVVCLAGFTSLSYAEDKSNMGLSDMKGKTGPMSTHKTAGELANEQVKPGDRNMTGDKSNMGLSDMKGKTGSMSTHKTPGELANEQVKPGDRNMTDDKSNMNLSDMKGKTGPMSTH
jgi:hypothetical protein